MAYATVCYALQACSWPSILYCCTSAIHVPASAWMWLCATVRVASQMIYESHLVTWLTRTGFPFLKHFPCGKAPHTWKSACSVNLSVKSVREKRSRWEPSSRVRTATRPYASVWRRLGLAGVDGNRTPFGPVFWRREKDYSWRGRLNTRCPKDTGRTDRPIAISWAQR